MPVIREKEYLLEGLRLLVPLHYDEALEQYFEEIPDFEEAPLYTPRGKPVVCAAQDACLHGAYEKGGRCVDCGGCRFFTTLHFRDLIGLCSHPARNNAHNKVVE